MRTFTDVKNATTSINFTKNLHGMMFRQNGTGRDGYIYANNGGFCSPQTFATNPNPPGRF
jgi:hypothetical protein